MEKKSRRPHSITGYNDCLTPQQTPLAILPHHLNALY
jgi:hypothetical protein